MKIKLILAAMICSLALWAQPKDTIMITVNGTEMIVLTDDINNLSGTDFNAIFNRLTTETKRIIAQNKEERAEIKRKQKAGELTTEQAAEETAAANERMSIQLEALNAEIENWADRYGEQIEENAEDAETWVEQWETNAEKYESAAPPAPPAPPAAPNAEEENQQTVVLIDEEGIRVEMEDEDIEWDPSKVEEAREKYKRNKTIGYFNWHFGWNNWFNDQGIATEQNVNPGQVQQTTELDFWPSMVWGFGFGGKTRFGASKFYIKYGGEFNWHHFRLKGNTILVKDQLAVPLNFDGVYFMEDATRNYSKSSYRIAYIDAPILFEFDASKPGRSNGFSIGVGGYAGLRINSKNKLIFTDYNNDRTETHIYNNFYTRMAIRCDGANRHWYI